MEKKKVLYAVIGVVLGWLVLSILSCIPIMLLWNWLMPEIFGLCEISLLQSFGITVLSSLLFKDLGSNSN